MATNPKYKLNNLAKELNIKSKDIIDLLDANGFKGKTHSSTLEADEFAYAVDAVTKENQITDINSYLDKKTYIRLPKTEKPKEEAAVNVPAPEKTAVEKTAVEKTAVEKTAVEKTVVEKTEIAPAKAANAAINQTTDKPTVNKAPVINNNNNININRNNQPHTNNAQTQNRQPQNKAPFIQQGANNNNNYNSNNTTQNRYNANNTNKTNNINNTNISNNTNINRLPNKNKPVQNQKTNVDNAKKMQERFANPLNKPAQPQQKKEQDLKKQNRQQFQQVQRKVNDENNGAAIVDVTASTSLGKTRVVDTRTINVDLSKYDEKLDKFVTDTSAANDSQKQKLKKQNNKPGLGNKQGGRNDSTFNKSGYNKFKRNDAPKQPVIKQQLAISVPEEISVGELASRLKVTAAEVIKRLMMLGVMANVNQVIDYDTAEYIGTEIGAKVSKEVVVTIEDKLFDAEEDSEENLTERAPVVVVMGHVDHGKTSLLDKIRNTKVTAGEAGGITQHIGAYRVRINDKDITFLDTPGHAAFTAMRARGAMATDIAILVVAADDGIMPQTVEAINHAKAAKIDIIVAINKMDKPGANPEGIKQELTKYDLVPEEWGGDTVCVPVSALTGFGIDDLLENVLILAEMKQLRANPKKRAKGTIIEARLDKGKGPVATVLVQNGTLNSGDIVIAGTAVGRIRAMTDEKGRTLKTAGPSVPVEIIGLAEVPLAGDEFNSVDDERMARTLADQRKAKTKQAEFNANAKVSLDDLFAQIKDGVKELNIIVKADVGGSAEAVKSSLVKISNDEVRVNVIHAAVGGITEGDVMFAAASNAIIVGFNVRPDKNAIDSAERQNVDIRTYRVIYECIDEITAAMKGMLAPVFKEQITGHAQVRQTIRIPAGTIAGSYVQDGKITRNSLIRVLRDGVVLCEEKISSLRRFKDDVKEVAQSYECGIGLEKFNDIRENDILEAYEMVEVKA